VVAAQEGEVATGPNRTLAGAGPTLAQRHVGQAGGLRRGVAGQQILGQMIKFSWA